MLSSLIFKYFAKSQRMYDFCKNFVDQYNGENNCKISQNGELTVMQKFLPTSRIVFDVGANVGDWTKLALEINANLAIHCFEPGSQAYKKLASRNFPESVVCNNTGLSSANKEEKLYLFDESSTLNSLHQRTGLEVYKIKTPEKTETIQLETLDSYCEKNKIVEIDFLKMDIEGHELEAFKGATRMFKEKNIKMVQFEYGGCNIDAKVLLKDIFEFFKTYDYKLYKIYPNEIKHVPKYAQTLENFQYQNWLALRQSREDFLTLSVTSTS